MSSVIQLEDQLTITAITILGIVTTNIIIIVISTCLSKSCDQPRQPRRARRGCRVCAEKKVTPIGEKLICHALRKIVCTPYLLWSGVEGYSSHSQRLLIDEVGILRPHVMCQCLQRGFGENRVWAARNNVSDPQNLRVVFSCKALRVATLPH